MAEAPQSPTLVGLAGEVVRSLSGSPACLAAVSLAALMALLTYYSLRDREAQSHDLMISILDHCPVERVKDDRS